jgi:protein-tyrosine phosphatase
MAEGLARKLLGPYIQVGSAGLAAWDGDPASRQAIEVLREKGIDLTAHRARRVSPELLDEADWIVPMTEEHERRLKAMFPEYALRIKRLGDWSTQGGIRDISDPYGGSVEIYRQCAEKLEVLIDEIKKKIG